MRIAAACLLASLAGCALDASVRVVTTATEECEWRETVTLGGPGDRFRVPAEALGARLTGENVPTHGVSPGDLLEVTRDDAAGTYFLILNGEPFHVIDEPLRARVEWARVATAPLRTEQAFAVPDDKLPWSIDWEIRPMPRRLPDGECRLEDVTTTAELVGPDADTLELDVTITPGRVQGTVRRKPE